MQSILDSVIKHVDHTCKDNHRHPIRVKLRHGDYWAWCETEEKEIPNKEQIVIDWDGSKGDLESYLKSNGGHTEFDPGWGVQELHGYIWYNDGTWSSRAEYDGSEWWEHNVCPDFNIEV